MNRTFPFCLSVLLCLSFFSCKKQERFQTDVSAYPKDCIGKWQVILRQPKTPLVFQAGFTVRESNKSTGTLQWQYFSQSVDTTNNRITPCGPEMDFFPLFWDDSLHLIRADHYAGKGGGYDNLQLLGPGQSRLNSFSLAPDCRVPFGMNAVWLVFSKVDRFNYKQPER